MASVGLSDPSSKRNLPTTCPSFSPALVHSTSSEPCSSMRTSSSFPSFAICGGSLRVGGEGEVAVGNDNDIGMNMVFFLMGNGMFKLSCYGVCTDTLVCSRLSRSRVQDATGIYTASDRFGFLGFPTCIHPWRVWVGMGTYRPITFTV